MNSRKCILPVLLLLPLGLSIGCRREEEDLAASTRRGGSCTEQTGAQSGSGDARGDSLSAEDSVLPPEVELTVRDELVAVLQSGNLEELIRMVEEDSVDLAEPDDEGKTTLMIAAEYGHTDLVEFLLERAPDLLSLEDSQGRNAVNYVETSTFIADDSVRTALVKLLRGEELTPVELEAEMLLILVAPFDIQGLVRIEELLDKGASPDATSLVNPAAPVPALFLAMGVRTNETSPRPNLSGSPVFEYAEVLVRKGARLDVTIRLRGDLTPYDLLMSRGAGDRFDERKDEWLALLD